jgi:superfamily II RNA helicase
MPARTVVLDGLKKFDGRDFNPLTVRQFLQKAGRAGRRGMDDVGYVVVRMDHADFGDFQHLIRKYQTGEPEPVRSSFGLSFNSVVHLLARHERERIQEIVSRSFLSFHLERRASSLEQRARSVEGTLRITLNNSGPLLPPPHALPQPLRRDARRAEKWRTQASKRRNRVWDDFEERVHFLTDIGYLNGDGSFREGATVVQKVQISEIFVTELFLGGYLDDLPPARLFGVLCAMVQNLPRGAQTVNRLNGETRALAKRVNRVRYGDVVTRAIQLTHQEVDWCPDLIPFGEMWAKGRPLDEVMAQLISRTDISGDLVGAFRRARDLAGQLAAVWAETNPDRSREVWELMRTTGRDEVEVVG